jgi:UDP-N-acetylmuramate--alanine ligase
MNRILMAGGGSLGPVAPLAAIKEKFPEADYLCVTTRSGPELAFLKNRGIRTVSISAGKLRRYVSWKNITDILNFIIGFFQSLYIVANYRPDIILTAGGFVAVPVVIAGRLLGKKIFVHQQDLEMGLANKIMAPFATKITVTFEHQLRMFPPAKAIYTGNPVRELPASNPAARPNIVILGGGQGSRGLNAFVNEFLPSLSTRFVIHHVLGKDNKDQTLSLPPEVYHSYQFVDKEIPQLLSEASIVITRGGLSTLTELAYLAKPVIIIPLPHSHQEGNAQFFALHKAAQMVPQGSGPDLLRAIELLQTDNHLALQQGKKLQELFNPRATEDYVALIKQNIALAIEMKPVAFLSGIGGIGLSALARYFLHQNYKVIGSDLTRSTVTEGLEAQGVKIFYEQTKKNLPENVSLFVYSSALPANHEELVEAKRLHIPTYTYNEYLGLLSEKYQTVAVSGTHGKTTTTGLVGYMTKEAGIDPTIIVGGLIPQFEGNFVAGNSDLLVVEACEYRSHMLNIKPKIIILTNIEEDHLDYFTDLKHIQNQFQKFIDALPPEGVLIRNADDANSQVITTNRNIITFGIDASADIQATNLVVTGQHQEFDLVIKGTVVDHITLQIPGRFNVYNALAAVALAHHLDLNLAIVKRCLSAFHGSWRRFEKIGYYHDCPAYSDYAHHPTAIKKTIEAAQKFYPQKKLFVIFQPHSYARTETLFERFSQAFQSADKVIITNTYEVAGREEHEQKDPAVELSQELGVQPHWYAASWAEAEKLLEEHYTADDILLFMGAGSIDSLARNTLRHA